MIERIANIFKIQELRERILFTLGIFLVVRLGVHVPTPGIDAGALSEFFQQSQNTLFGLYDMFTGGAFQKVAIFGLGIMPYISASIIIQLLGTVTPYFQRLQKEGEQGRKKITQLTRYGTVMISALQASGVAAFLLSVNSPSGAPIVLHPGVGFYLITMLMLTTGTMVLMWLGEQIDARGIGNGISLIITIGIIEGLPRAFLDEFQQLSAGTRPILAEIFLLALMVLTIMAVVLLTTGVRRIPIQYAKRVVGRREFRGQSTVLPLRINTAGVMPIIFAQSIMFLPSTLVTFLPEGAFREGLTRAFDFNSLIYMFLYWLMIVFFTYYYTAIAFNPTDVADNLKKHGGFIPGVRPGKKTADFIDNILTRITLPASIFLGFIAIFPNILVRFSGDLFGSKLSYSTASFFGGTGLLIIVGVALDTLQQVESHLTMRNYDGLMKGGAKMKGRR